MLFKGITIIGAGNIGSAIVNGLLNSAPFNPEDITIYDKEEKAKKAMLPLGIHVADSLSEAVNDNELIIICVKPFHMHQVLTDIKNHLGNDNILISVAAGISSDDIVQIIGQNTPVILAMPNTGIRVRQSMTCLSSPNASKKQMLKTQELFNLLGKTLVVEEKMMGAGTVIAGCGTAFGLRFIRAIMTGAVEIGFTAQQAKEMALQIVLGSCSLLEDSGVHPEEEIDKVTTPGGITITAINEMENNGFSSSVIKGIVKAHNKIKK